MICRLQSDLKGCPLRSDSTSSRHGHGISARCNSHSSDNGCISPTILSLDSLPKTIFAMS